MSQGVGAGVKVGATAVLVALTGYMAFKFVSKGIASDSGYEVWELFKDATGLVDKSRVQIAGLLVGEVHERTLAYEETSHATMARVVLAIKPDVVLWSNAIVYKRSASLLGEFYIEIDPGTPTRPDPLHPDQPIANYPLKGCVKRTGDHNCNRINSVVEAVTAADLMVQVSETLPVLRDILRDVHELTSGPMKDIASEVQSSIRQNSDAASQLLKHMDTIAGDLHTATSVNGPIYHDLKSSMENIRNITENVRNLVGTGEGQINTTGDKIKRDLDQLAVTLDKLNHSIDQVSDLTTKIAEGQGTVGKLLTDDTIARNIRDITEDASGFVRSITRLQTIVGVREEYNILGNSWKTYLTLNLQPRPDKYYQLEFIDDPRGNKNYNHVLQTTQSNGGSVTTNTDNYTRTTAFRFSFMFAKRLPYRGVGFTGLVGIKESTGGVSGIFDAWKQRFQLRVDFFDTASEDNPRLKIWAALELFRHVWVLGGVDDLLNGHTGGYPAGIICNAAGVFTGAPSNWCQGGRDYFVGAMLSFNDDDLRALLTIGGAAIAGGASGK